MLAVPQGPLVRRSVDKTHIKGWRDRCQEKCGDIERTENSASTRIDAAYDVVLFSALSVLMAEGIRGTGKPGHHELALEGAAYLLQLPELLYDDVLALKDSRNAKYSPNAPVTEADVAFAAQTAEKAGTIALAWLQANHAKLLT